METLSIIALSLWFIAKTVVLMYSNQPDMAYYKQFLQAPIEKEHKVAIKEPPKQYILPETQFVAQTYNNCGPAALSMMLSMYGKKVSQEELGSQMRPFSSPDGGIDDKSIFPNEFITYAEKYGFKALQRPNGTLDLLKTLTANGIPVVVRTWLSPGEDIGHFRIVRGYDEERQVIIQDDSYQGPNLEYSYEDFEGMWRPFNYGYILVYPKDKQKLVDRIVGEEKNETIAYKNAITRAEKELQEEEHSLAYFNIATAHYHLGNYQKSIEAFEKSETHNLPSRMLWYQLEPIQAYEQLKNYDRVFALSDAILYNGNEAYSELYQMKGEIYLTQGDKTGAKSEFEKALYYNTNYEKAKKALEAVSNI